METLGGRRGTGYVKAADLPDDEDEEVAELQEAIFFVCVRSEQTPFKRLGFMIPV